MEAYILAAIDQGLTSYGVSSHAPLPFKCKWSMPLDKVKDYFRRLKYLQSQWGDRIQIYAGMEVDYVPEKAGPRSQFIQSLPLDYTIGSIHFIDFIKPGKAWEIDGANTMFREGLDVLHDNNIRSAIERYYALTREMVLQSPPTIVGHLDKIKIQNSFDAYFSEEEIWYKQAVTETLRAIASKDLLIEVNTRGFYKGKTDLYPSPKILHQMHKMGLAVTLNSDSHLPEEITKGFSYAYEVLYEAGYREVYALIDGSWQALALGKNGLLANKSLIV